MRTSGLILMEMTNETLIIVFSIIYLLKIILNLMHVYSKTYEWEEDIKSISGFVSKPLMIFGLKFFKCIVLSFVFETKYKWLTISINVLVGIVYLILAKLIFFP